MSATNPDHPAGLSRYRWTLLGLGLAVTLFGFRFGVRFYQLHTIAGRGGGSRVTTKPAAPQFLRGMLGDNLVSYFEPVEAISLECRSLQSPPANAAHLIWCVTGLAEVESLQLCGARISNASVQSLQKLPQLKSLSLRETAVDEAGLACLANLPHLESLTLEGTVIGDRALDAISGIRTLECLTFRSPGITDAGMHHLATLPHLRQLILDHATITDTGLLELQHVRSLLELSVSQTQVTDEGIEALHRLRPELNITDD
jgi:hypothetical protein